MKKRIAAGAIFLFVIGTGWCLRAFIVRKQSQTSACVGNMRFIDAAKEQWALETGATNGPVDVAGITRYMKGGMPTCPGGGAYSVGKVSEDPICTVHGSIFGRRYATGSDHASGGSDVRDR